MKDKMKGSGVFWLRTGEIIEGLIHQFENSLAVTGTEVVYSLRFVQIRETVLKSNGTENSLKPVPMTSCK